mmetsp:Transcript_39560/g.35346  ORF Transcript_39560/g.35346 Transcript_39560/m.35346 type:complete len:251 (+) Transcript_39560:225-977(+)|eukprot:CAMPEP_0114586234 /NCGR_PEP_ID=MMETSP0125-20121206/9513_1 /TAXON_ID=485358 ORGANISM="Aristerostoma sp., Strain ATCC 50986" /NCGR_SAMPLE_ID=MMETSP0125 /ASSEMBLY_ACC=CAM_ASM_000245 /LENGTH=250 /DNA_ID=CAMNT_0001781579 /DNA_START=225 /DNA_END=977 /DNA_ORIENTATION=+
MDEEVSQDLSTSKVSSSTNRENRYFDDKNYAQDKEFLKYMTFKIQKQDRYYKISYYLSWLSWFGIAFFGTAFSMYALIPTGAAMFFMATVMIAKLIFQQNHETKQIEEVLSQRGHETEFNNRLVEVRKRYRRVLFLILFMSLFVPYFFSEFCLAPHNAFNGLVIGNAAFSTGLTRALSMDHLCPEGKACHIYATLPEDTAHSVFINAHTNMYYDTVAFSYDTEEYYNANKKLRYSAHSKGIQTKGVPGYV